MKHWNCSAVHKEELAAAAGDHLHMPHNSGFLEYGNTMTEN